MKIKKDSDEEIKKSILVSKVFSIITTIYVVLFIIAGLITRKPATLLLALFFALFYIIISYIYSLREEILKNRLEQRKHFNTYLDLSLKKELIRNKEIIIIEEFLAQLLKRKKSKRKVVKNKKNKR